MKKNAKTTKHKFHFIRLVTISNYSQLYNQFWVLCKAEKTLN